MEENEENHKTLVEMHVNENSGTSCYPKKNNHDENLVLLIDAAIANIVNSNALDKLPPNNSQQNGNHLGTCMVEKKNNDESTEKGKFASNCDNVISTAHGSLEKMQPSQVQSDILSDSTTFQCTKEPVIDCNQSINDGSNSVEKNETIFENTVLNTSSTSQNMEELTNNHSISENNLSACNLLQKESNCVDKIEMASTSLTSQNTEQCLSKLNDCVNNSHEPGSLHNIEDCLKDLMDDLVKEIVSKDSAVQTSKKLVSVLRNKTNKINYSPVQGGKIHIKIPRRRKSKHHECCEENHNISHLEETMEPTIVADVTPIKKKGVKKRSYENEPIDPLWLEPFKLDWKRELVIRSTNSATGPRLSDVYYFSPEGQKLRSYREIQTFLITNHITDVTIENFTFQKRQIYEFPHDVVRDAVARGGKGISKTPPMLPKPSHNKLPKASQSAPTIKISLKKTGQKRELPVNENATPVRLKIKKVAKELVVPPLKISCIETSGRKKSKPNKIWQVKETPPPSLKLIHNPSLASKPATHNILNSSATQKSVGKANGANNAQAVVGALPARKAAGMNEKIKLNVSSSAKNSAHSSASNSKGTQSRPKGKKDDDIEVGIPSCSMNCPSLRDVMPTLQCTNCLIFYHPSCSKVKEGEPQDSFVCVNCRIRNKQQPAISSKDSFPCPIEPELVINSEPESPSNRSNGSEESPRTENFKASLSSTVAKHNKPLGPPPLKRAPLAKAAPSEISKPDISNSPRLPPPLQRKPPVTPSTPPKINHTEPRNIPKPVIPCPPPLHRGAPSRSTKPNTPILNRSAVITSRLLQYSNASPTPILLPASSFPSDFAVPVPGGTVMIRTRAPNPMFSIPANMQRVVTAPVAAIPSSITTPIKKLTGKLTSSQLALSSHFGSLSHPSGQTTGELNNNQQAGQPNKQSSTSHSRALKRSQWLSEKANSSHNFFHKLQFRYRFLMDVFKHLNTVDLVKASSVCKLWKDASLQEELWKTIKLKGITVSDWEKLVKIMQKKGTRRLDLTEMKTFEDCNRTWHEFVAALQQIKTTKLEEINFGYVSVSVFHAVLDILTDIKVLTAESIVDVMNSSHGISSCRLRLGNIEKLKNLRKLRLRGVHGINLPLTQNYSNLNELATLQHLNHLALTSLKDVPSSEFMFLKDLTNLTTLELGSCKNWTTQEYKHLLHLKNLSRLRLECGSDKEGRLGLVLRNSKIQILELIDFRIDLNLLKDISAMQSLEGLSLKPDDSLQPKILNAVIMENVKYLKCLKVFKWQVKVQNKNTPDDDDIIVLAETILEDSQCSGDAEPSRRMNNIPFLVSVINSSTEYTNIEHLTNSILKVLNLRCKNGKVLLYGSDESRDVNSFNFISTDEIQKVQSLNVN